MKNAFVLMSSICEDEIYFSREEQFSQVLEGIDSVKKKDPFAFIILVDNSIGLDESLIIERLKTSVDLLICLKDLYPVSFVKTKFLNDSKIYENWTLDIISSIESLRVIGLNFDLSEIDRVFIIANGCRLMNGFDIGYYSIPECNGKYVLKKRIQTGINEYPFTFILDLWSFPSEFLQKTIESLCESFYECLMSGVPIGRAMSNFLAKEPVHEVHFLHAGCY